MSKHISVIFFLLFAASTALAGFDGANAPGGQQVGGAPNSSQTGGVGYKSGKPSSAKSSSGSKTPEGGAKSQKGKK